MGAIYLTFNCAQGWGGVRSNSPAFSFRDPIKSLLGVGIHRDTRVIIKRRFVQGGDAQVIPERACQACACVGVDAFY